jgi:hypothetical protein
MRVLGHRCPRRTPSRLRVAAAHRWPSPGLRAATKDRALHCATANIRAVASTARRRAIARSRAPVAEIGEDLQPELRQFATGTSPCSVTNVFGDGPLRLLPDPDPLGRHAHNQAAQSAPAAVSVNRLNNSLINPSGQRDLHAPCNPASNSSSSSWANLFHDAFLPRQAPHRLCCSRSATSPSTPYRSR